MFPGMNKRKMEKVMRQMGVKQESIDAEEVIIKAKDKNLVIRNPEVVKVNMMGQDSIQITGDMREESAEEFSEEDVKTVVEQAGCSEEEAREALKETKDIAEAIIKLKKE